MPDPICSLNPNSPNTCGNDDELSSSVSTASAITSEPPAPAAPTQTLNAPSEAAICAVPSLVAKFTPPPPTTVVVDKALHHQHTDSGPLKGSDLQYGKVLVQHGDDTDAQVAAMRGTLIKSKEGYSLSVSAEALTAGVSVGRHNDDGSDGVHFGAGAEFAGAEVTLGTPYFSATGGLSASLSASLSMGIRDRDHDGKPEYCVKGSLFVTEGLCMEQFW